MDTAAIINFITAFQENGVEFIFKILLLAAIFVYMLFSLILISRVKALNRTIFLAAAGASAMLQLVTVIFFLLAVSLFIATIVIV